MKKLKQLLARLSARERAIFYGVVIVVAALVTEQFIYEPIVARLHELDEEILVAEGQVRRNLREIAARETVRAAYEQYAAHATPAGSDEEEMARLLGEIAALAGTSGVSLLDVRSRPASVTQFGKQYPVELEAEAGMAALVGFLHGLQSSKRLLRVKQLRLTPKEGHGAVKASVVIHETVLR
jgi:type II secretory pathway component PulM